MGNVFSAPLEETDQIEKTGEKKKVEKKTHVDPTRQRRRRKTLTLRQKKDDYKNKNLDPE